MTPLDLVSWGGYCAVIAAWALIARQHGVAGQLASLAGNACYATWAWPNDAWSLFSLSLTLSVINVVGLYRERPCWFRGHDWRSHGVSAVPRITIVQCQRCCAVRDR